MQASTPRGDLLAATSAPLVWRWCRGRSKSGQGQGAEEGTFAVQGFEGVLPNTQAFSPSAKSFNCSLLAFSFNGFEASKLGGRAGAGKGSGT